LMGMAVIHRAIVDDRKWNQRANADRSLLSSTRRPARGGHGPADEAIRRSPR
jgi:hypothetical protein